MRQAPQSLGQVQRQVTARPVQQLQAYQQQVTFDPNSDRLAKLLMQFKSFMMGAYTKQLLNNVKHADRVTTMMFLNGTFAGLVSYLAYVGASSAGKSSYERERYLDKMLDPMQMAAGAFQRSSISTIIPGIIDMPAMLGLYDPLFDTRASGLQSNLITGSCPSSCVVWSSDSIRARSTNRCER